MFEINYIMFRPHLQTSEGFNKKIKSETKLTVVILIRSLQRYLAAISAGDRRQGRPVDKIRIFVLFFLVNCLLDQFRGQSSLRGSLRKFSISCHPCGGAGEAWRSTTLNMAKLFLVFPISCFFKHRGDLRSIGKCCGRPQLLLRFFYTKQIFGCW